MCLIFYFEVFYLVFFGDLWIFLDNCLFSFILFIWFKKCVMKLYLVLYNGLKYCFEIEIFFLYMFKNLGFWLVNNI